MSTFTVPRQLSFDIGCDVPRPTGASFTITGRGDIRNQLLIGDDIILRVGREVVIDAVSLHREHVLELLDWFGQTINETELSGASHSHEVPDASAAKREDRLNE